MEYIEIIGYLAGFLTTVALLPQALKSWKSKHTKDVSLGWITILIVGVTLWFVYGLFIGSKPVILANLFTLILAILILFMKLKYK